jgi:glutamate-1-semialdehyde 2,1-aminomutase
VHGPTTESEQLAPSLTTERSRELHERARMFLPAGVTGDGRYSTPYPVVFESARGKTLTDIDGNTYLDLHCGFGSVALGYGEPRVDAAVHRAMDEVGAVVGAPHVHEQQLAERLCSLIPGADMVALCGGGGSDAIYHAVRLARAATSRPRVAKVEGGYHGWHGDVGVSTKPPLEDTSHVGLPTGVPNSRGILPAVSEAVSILAANDEEALRLLFEREGDQLAALILEPVLYSPGCITLDQSYVELARSLCTEYGTVLILDEVMTGFRNGLAGAGAQFGIAGDLGAFGKAMANGYIIAALVGRRDLVEHLAPSGPVFYSGTFNGHPLSVAAAQATLDILESDDVPAHLSRLTERVTNALNKTIRDLGVNAVCQGHGGVWTLYFKTRSVRDYRDLARSVAAGAEPLNEGFRRFLLDRRIYMHKRHMNRCFVSAQHDDADMDRVVETVTEFLTERQDEIGS